MSYNRLGSLRNDTDINSTWEGDGNVLLMQAQKYLLKAAKTLDEGTPLPYTVTLIFSYIHLTSIVSLDFSLLESEFRPRRTTMERRRCRTSERLGKNPRGSLFLWKLCKKLSCE